MSVMSPEQCRAARGWLKLTQWELANASGVSKMALTGFENSTREPTSKTVHTLQSFLEGSGIRFLFDEDGMPNGLADRDLDSINPARDLTITPRMCRAARLWLDWTQPEMSQHCTASVTLIRDFETERLRRGQPYYLLPSTTKPLLKTFNEAGVHFLFVGNKPVGMQVTPVRVKTRLVA